MSGSGSGGEPAARGGRRSSAERVEDLERQVEALREQLRIEQLKLEQTEAALWQMSVLFGNVPVPVVLLDVDGVITDANHEAEREFGKRREELLGEHLLTLVLPNRHARCESALDRCREGRIARGIDHELWGGSTSRRATWSLFPIRDPDRRIVGMALAEDIQELKEEGELLQNVNRELQQLASLDPLTGLANRREYERTLAVEVGRAARNGRLLSLAMLDVDEFKVFNDELGHAAGDRCLSTVGRALRASLHRPGDLVARYGGEEFVALLPGTGTGGARLLAERMRRSVEQMRIRHPRSEASAFVTVSIGIATVRPVPGFDGRALQEAADRALYAAKRGGRNRVHAEELTAPREKAAEPRAVEREEDRRQEGGD